MALSLRELLREPALRLTLVAGLGGLDTRGPVRWAHISELPDPTPWLEGGEILLTTGLGVRDSEQEQRGLIAGLDERQCAGVGFGVGVVVDQVPPALRDEADRRELPLFTVPYEVPFLAVTKEVSRRVFAEHYGAMRAAVDLHRSVLAAVLSGAGVKGVLETVTRPMPDLGWVLFDYYGQVLARSTRLPAATPAMPDLWRALGAAGESREPRRLQLADVLVTAAEVRLGTSVEAVLALLGSRPLLEHELLLVEQGLTGVSLELARGLSVREAHRARVDDLLVEVAEQRISQRALTLRLARLGADPSAPYRMLCLRSASEVSEPALCNLVEDVLVTTGSTVVLGRHDRAVYGIVQPAEGAQAEQLAAAIAARGWSTVHIGRSRAHSDMESLRRAMRESATAAAAPGGNGQVRDVGSLGLAGLLAGLGDELAAEAFVGHVLGAAVDADQRAGSHLLDTMRAYLRHGCRPGPAAAELGVHRHTLSYRLDRVAALTGKDLRDGVDLLEVGLALELQATRQAPA